MPQQPYWPGDARLAVRFSLIFKDWNPAACGQALEGKLDQLSRKTPVVGA